MARMTVLAGTTGLWFKGKSRSAKTVRINTSIQAEPIRSETWGCDEHARECFVFLIEGKEIIITATKVFAAA